MNKLQRVVDFASHNSTKCSPEKLAFDRLQDTFVAEVKTGRQRRVMTVGNWKKIGVAVGCVLGRRLAYFTWAANLITTLFIFAVLENPHSVPEQEEDSQAVFVFYDSSYHRIYGTDFF